MFGLQEIRAMRCAMRIRCTVGACALLAAAAVAAAPADDHQRGLQAYQRGDVAGAMRELRRAADAGHAPSQSMLAFILDRADYADEAARLYREAAQRDDAQGHDGLGTAYLIGRGLPRNEKLAWLHFSKAADLGHAAAIEKVADGWRTGKLVRDGDTPPDAPRVALLRAAERDHLPSIDALAAAHRNGLYGVAVDAAQAEQWRARGDALRKSRAAQNVARAASATSR
jgi:TPR repeat protein